MMHQPTKVERQTAEGVVSDLEAQWKRLEQAISWTKSVVSAVRGCGKQVVFTTVGPLLSDSREVGIALSLPAGSQRQDVFVFSIVAIPPEGFPAQKWQETALETESLRLARLLAWNKDNVKVFETWFVNDCPLWRGSNEETQAFLTKEVKGWLTYWFGQDAPLPVYLPRKALELHALGKRPIK